MEAGRGGLDVFFVNQYSFLSIADMKIYLFVALKHNFWRHLWRFNGATFFATALVIQNYWFFNENAKTNFSEKKLKFRGNVNTRKLVWGL